MPKPLRLLVLGILSLTCSGCTTTAPSTASKAVTLMRMYRECIEKHVGDPDAIKKNCEPIVAPLRIQGLEE